MKLEKLRKQNGLSRKDLGDRVGVSARTIEAYEYGAKDINGAKLKTLLLLCSVLNCRLQDIIEDFDLITLIEEYEK